MNQPSILVINDQPNNFNVIEAILPNSAFPVE